MRYSLRRGILLVAFLLVGLFVAAPVAAEHSEDGQLLSPHPDRTARDVVGIQLEALRHNDIPSRNAGIEQVWAFAHPRNRVITGPLSRFARMLRGPGYSVLVNHRVHEIAEIRINETQAAFGVRVLAREGGFFRFLWRLETVEQPAGRVWMTTAVTPAERTGEQLTGRDLHQGGVDGDIAFGGVGIGADHMRFLEQRLGLVTRQLRQVNHQINSDGKALAIIALTQ